jgi:hypothetical protein
LQLTLFFFFFFPLAPRSSSVAYLSHQDSNLTNQFPTLLGAEVPLTVPLASRCLDRDPDAVNLWVGDARSVTTVHRDPYHNFYLVVSGWKEFVLLPPTDVHGLGPVGCKPARVCDLFSLGFGSSFFGFLKKIHWTHKSAKTVRPHRRG